MRAGNALRWACARALIAAFLGACVLTFLATWLFPGAVDPYPESDSSWAAGLAIWSASIDVLEGVRRYRGRWQTRGKRTTKKVKKVSGNRF
jgi:hypothetical protein